MCPVFILLAPCGDRTVLEWVWSFDSATLRSNYLLCRGSYCIPQFIFKALSMGLTIRRRRKAFIYHKFIHTHNLLHYHKAGDQAKHALSF